jgi:hypothetical protein
MNTALIALGMLVVIAGAAVSILEGDLFTTQPLVRNPETKARGLLAVAIGIVILTTGGILSVNDPHSIALFIVQVLMLFIAAPTICVVLAHSRQHAAEARRIRQEAKDNPILGVAAWNGQPWNGNCPATTDATSTTTDKPELPRHPAQSPSVAPAQSISQPYPTPRRRRAPSSRRRRRPTPSPSSSHMQALAGHTRPYGSPRIELRCAPLSKALKDINFFCRWWLLRACITRARLTNP